MSMVSRGIKAGLTAIQNNAPVSGRIPPAAKPILPSQENMASGFVPLAPPNDRPAGEVDPTSIQGTLNRLEELDSGQIPRNLP